MFSQLLLKFKQISPVVWLLLLILAYFIFHFINGSRGLISYFEIQDELEQKREQLATLKRDAGALENRVRLMRDGQVDPDMLEEQAKILIKMYAKDEYLLTDAPTKAEPGSNLRRP